MRVVESQRRTARERFSRIITTLISSLLLLPVVHSIVDIVRDWASVPSQAYPSWVQLSFVWLVERVKTRPTLSTLVPYLMIFAATLSATWGGGIVNWLRRKQRAVPAPQAMRSTARTLSPMSLTIDGIDDTHAPKENTTEENCPPWSRRRWTKQQRSCAASLIGNCGRDGARWRSWDECLDHGTHEMSRKAFVSFAPFREFRDPGCGRSGRR